MYKKIIRTPYPKREIWKPCFLTHKNKIVEFPDYSVSNLGRIKRTTKGYRTIPNRILYGSTNGSGYKYIGIKSITGKFYNVLVHRFVAHVFIGPCPDGKEVNHRNGIKLINIYTNLEYVSGSENKKHAFRLGLRNHLGSKHPKSKLNEQDARIIKKLLRRKNRPKIINIAKQFKISTVTIYKIKSNKLWKHVT